MEEMLYIWAKEHPEYKYQQGLNEILAMVMVALASELLFESKPKLTKTNSSEEEDEDTMNDPYSIATDPNKMFAVLHDKNYFIEDSYSLFERIMDLGMKELYYKDTDTKRT